MHDGRSDNRIVFSTIGAGNYGIILQIRQSLCKSFVEYTTQSKRCRGMCQRFLSGRLERHSATTSETAGDISVPNSKEYFHQPP